MARDPAISPLHCSLMSCRVHDGAGRSYSDGPGRRGCLRSGIRWLGRGGEQLRCLRSDQKPIIARCHCQLLDPAIGLGLTVRLSLFCRRCGYRL